MAWFLVSYLDSFICGEIAQLVERRTHKPKVKGSIPFLATIPKNVKCKM